MITIRPRAVETKLEAEVLAVNSREASKMLGVSERTLFKLAKEGKIVCKKIGWRSLYPVASLKAFLEKPDEE